LWETKAVLDISKGLYIPCNPPIELFEKWKRVAARKKELQ
jgi:hypothetical protein